MSVEQGTSKAGVAPSGSKLGTGQLVAVIVVGVVFWYAGALSVRLGGPAGMFGPTASLAAFAAALPVGWLGVVIAALVARLRPEQIVPGIAVGTAAATMCDGMALTWARWLYGTDTEQVLFGAAWILWGAGAFFLAAFFEAWRRQK